MKMVCATCAAIQAFLTAGGVPDEVARDVAYSGPVRRAEASVKTAVKRKVGRYQKTLGKHLKSAKKAHPRMVRSNLMKLAHKATRKQRKRQGW